MQCEVVVEQPQQAWKRMHQSETSLPPDAGATRASLGCSLQFGIRRRQSIQTGTQFMPTTVYDRTRSGVDCRLYSFRKIRMTRLQCAHLCRRDHQINARIIVNHSCEVFFVAFRRKTHIQQEAFNRKQLLPRLEHAFKSVLKCWLSFLQFALQSCR